MSDDRYLWDGSGEPDPEIVRLEQALSPLRYKGENLKPAQPKRSRKAVIYGVLAIAAAALLFFALRGRGSRDESGPAFAVTRLTGAPRVSETKLGATGRLPIGAWLETDGESEARIEVAQIGEVHVEPGSRVRLVGTTDHEHRLELSRGGIEARVLAPPRLFVVDTPAATAVDLGCAYRLDVDDQGRGRLRVDTGQVSLEGGGHTSWVPAGALCEMRPGRGPGTPYFADASAALRAALRSLDFEDGGPAALAVVLIESRARDTLSLWHLLPRVTDADRASVAARMNTLSPFPPGVTLTDLEQMRPSKYLEYKQDLVTHW